MLTFSRLGSLGRLGNQMFQYAALRGAANAAHATHGIPPGTDLEAFQLETARGHWQATASYDEPAFAFDARVLRLPDGTDLKGYFQSPKYFTAVAPTLRREFRLRPEYAAPLATITQRARDTAGGAPRVGVHVRRGDYVKKSRVHPPCEPAYYARAAARVGAGPRALYIVCSDDLPWCRAHLRLPGSVFEEPPGLHPAQTLHLLAACDHQIIANSSLSWWGAWLARPGGTVVAPARWTGPDGPQDTQDLCPPEWVRL
jgi:hypothetical protein